MSTTSAIPDGTERARALRVLVVADDACTSPSLCTSVRAYAGSGPVEALVVAPVRGTPATQWYVDEDAARADATSRLRRCLGCLGDRGISVHGRLGDEDLVQAVADALEGFAADRILIVSAPQRPSTWLRRSAVERVRQAFSQPVDHVVLPPSA
jgi:hypothetical protein